jgi:hypothetical protein
MKTILTTICLAIILQFSAQTTVYADTATICAGEKWRAENQGIQISKKCKRNAAYSESSNLIPKTLLVIVIIVVGFFGFVIFVVIYDGIKESRSPEGIKSKKQREMWRNFAKSYDKYRPLKKRALRENLKKCNPERLETLGLSPEKTDSIDELFKKLMVYELNDYTKDELLIMAGFYTAQYDKSSAPTIENTEAQIISDIWSKGSKYFKFGIWYKEY